MPTAAAIAGIDSVDSRSRCRARSSRRPRMYATTVAPVAVWNRRVRWLWDKPTAAAISGTASARGRFASMWASAAETAGWCPAPPGSGGSSVRRHRTVQTSAVVRAGASGAAATARRSASDSAGPAGPGSRMTGAVRAAPSRWSRKWA